VVASSNDGLWCDSNTGKEVDLDELYSVDLIRNITYDDEDKKFYFLSNKKSGQLGFYLIEFKDNNPHDYTFITMW
jgi:hypothetical protein